MNADEFVASIEAFPVEDLSVAIEPAIDARVRSALSTGAVVLIGETHGVRENPLILYTLARHFDVRCLGLEWSPLLEAVVDKFLSDGRLAYAPIANSADGRITAGHFAVLRALRREHRLDRLVLFSLDVRYSNWSDRDRDMAKRLLAGIASQPAMAVAGNLHTSFERHRHGVPMGVHVVNERPSSIEIRVEYLRGAYFNLHPKRFHPGLRSCMARPTPSLEWKGRRALITIPEAHLASVPAGWAAS